MDTIIHEEISQVLLRNDIAILSEMKDAVFYKVGGEVQAVKYNHYDFKVLVTHIHQEQTKDAIEVKLKPYIILHPRDKAYFRILKASVENKALKLDTIRFPQYNFHEGTFKIMVIDNESLTTAIDTKPYFPRKAPALNPDDNGCSDMAALKRVQKELYTKNQLLERINTDLNNFVYTSSHDLLAPLSSIEAMINVLDQKMGSPDAEKEIIQLIRVSILKFKERIQELAEVGKVEAEMLTEMNAIDVSELLEEVIMSMQDEILSSHTSIIIQIAENEIKFSKKNLRSILYNLMSNGIKFKSPERDPQITISTHIHQGFLILSVQDNGLGIEKSQIPTIFMAYKRLHPYVNGQGIGLYLVKKIIDASGGSIEVESDEGIGSTFKIFFKV